VTRKVTPAGTARGSRSPSGYRRVLVLRPAFLLASLGCAGGAGGDVIPASRDVVSSTPAPSQGAQGYEYVARRPLAVVALAEARGIESVTARAAVDRLADRLDACITDEARKGGPVEGAARVVAQIDATGAVAATRVRIDPGASSASNAVVCLVAPMKLLTFPPGSADGRGIAIEALWGRVSAPVGP
jgi:hypothetical protein